MAVEKHDARQAFVLAPGEGEILPAPPPGSSVTVKAGGPFLECPVTVAEGLFDPSREPPAWTPRHRHHRFSELCYVLAGEASFLIGEAIHRMEAGAFVSIPPGTVHAYRPSVEQTTRLLFIAIPGGFEGMFEEGMRMPADAEPGTFWRELSRKYDMEVVGPPPEG